MTDQGAIYGFAFQLSFKSHHYLPEVYMQRLLLVWVATLLVYGASFTSANAALPEDTYISGYAAAILEYKFHVPSTSLRVQRGVIQINTDDFTGVDQQQLVDSLASIPGVVQVELHGQGQLLVSAPGKQPPLSALQGNGKPGETGSTAADESFLPQGYLFDQLSADPRWPHFSVAYQYYISDKELGSTATANFGETFALYRNRGPFGGLWEFGVQGGVFSLFDLARKSKDLINADYIGGIFAAYRYNDFATILRVFHQSSHLGDEFLLRNRVRRVNLSYEQVEGKLSYTFFRALRVYGGGGYLFDQEPANLAPWRVQYGLEFTSPWRLAGGGITPILAGDFQNEEENNWSTNFSARGGVQFENWKLGQRRLQLLVEYFHGHSPNGQFYSRKIETIGMGAHLRF